MNIFIQDKNMKSPLICMLYEKKVIKKLKKEVINNESINERKY